MTDTFGLVGRLHAYRLGRAVRFATNRQVSVAPHAVIIAPLAMAGEDTAIHAVAIGRIGQPPEIKSIPDPRVRDDQYELVEWIGARIEAYYQTCRDAGDHPQIWTSSGAAAGHLDILADRLRFTRDAPNIKRVGELLTYATERMPIAGQQALMTATSALAAHYCTGQQEGEDEHLGTVLTWLNPPPGMSIARAVEMAERQVMGVKTDPEFDRNELQPLVSAYNGARKNGASAAEITRRAADIEAKLAPVALAIYDAIQRSFAYFRDLPPAGILAELSSAERQEFQNFMNGRDADMPLPYRDSPKAGAFKLAAREVAASNLDHGAIYGDAIALARARLKGTVLSGTVRNSTQTKVFRKTIYRFDVATEQGNLHIRSGDELALVDDARLRCMVERVRRIGTTTTASFAVTAGMRSPGAPSDGDFVDIAIAPPDWGQIWRTRKQMSKRLSVTPWTHANGGLPAREPRPQMPQPNDLVSAVERLR